MIIVAVVGQKGGSSKSSVARALAVTCAKPRAKKVLLIDLDVNQMTSAKWAATRTASKLTPTIAAQLVDLETDGLESIINAKADIVIVDAPGWTDAATAQLAKIATHVIIPSGTSMDDINPAIQLYYDLEADPAIDHTRAVVVLARVATDAEANFARQQFDAAGVPFVKPVFKESPLIRRAHNVGLSAVEVSNSSVSGDAQALMADLKKRITDAGKRNAVERETWTYQPGDEGLL